MTGQRFELVFTVWAPSMVDVRDLADELRYHLPEPHAARVGIVGVQIATVDPVEERPAVTCRGPERLRLVPEQKRRPRLVLVREPEASS